MNCFIHSNSLTPSHSATYSLSAVLRDTDFCLVLCQITLLLFIFRRTPLCDFRSFLSIPQSASVYMFNVSSSLGTRSYVSLRSTVPLRYRRIDLSPETWAF